MTVKTCYKTLKAYLQRQRLRWGKALLDHTPPPCDTPLAAEHIRSVLLIRTDGKIGDSIIAMPIFNAVKAANPHIHTAVLCTPELTVLFEKNTAINRIYTLRRKKFFDYLRIGQHLARQFDVVIHLSEVLRNRDLLLLRLLAAPYNVGLGNAALFNVTVNKSNEAMSNLYQTALQRCGFHSSLPPYALPHPLPEREAAVDEFVRQHQLAGCIAVNFFGASNSRCFSTDTVIRYLDYFGSTFPQRRFLILTHPQITAALKELCVGRDNIYLYEDTRDILDSIALIRHAALVITPDTAIAHIAAASDKPLVAFYRNDANHIARWQPQSAQAVQLLLYHNDINEIDPQQLDTLLHHLFQTA